MDISIIIVSWNVRELLGRLLESIFQLTQKIQYEIIVIDNQSKDGTVDYLTRHFKTQIQDKRLKIIANDYNAGWAKANNQGLARAQGKYLAFLNPDMELLEDSFGRFVEFMEQSPNVGLVTSRLVYGDNTIQPNVKGNPTLFSQVLILLKLHHFFFWLPTLKKYLRKDFDYTQKQYVAQIMGAFIFTRQTLMAQLKGWDEDYWLWWEEVDLCRRVQKLGQDIVYLPITEIKHYEGKSFAQTGGIKKQRRFNKGMLTYFRKHHSRAARLVLQILQPISLCLAFLTNLFKIKPRPQSRV